MKRKTVFFVLQFVVISLVIGNVVAWFQGAAPIDFPKVAIDGRTKQRLADLKEELERNPDAVGARIDIGQAYSTHNYIDRADHYLARAYREAPENRVAEASYYANEAKRMGAMLDLSMGLYKLYRLSQVRDGLNDAVAHAPGNLEVRLWRLATFAGLASMGEGFDRIAEDGDWIRARIEEYPDRIPDRVRFLAWASLARAALAEHAQSGAEGYPDKAASYFARVRELGTCPDTLAPTCERIARRLENAKQG